MKYTIKELADLAGISTRALRYYHQMGLLVPAETSPVGYRLYGEKEVDILQQILLYKEMGLELAQIKELLASPDFDRLQSMEEHLNVLLTKKEHLEIMIENVRSTIKEGKGMITMTDKEKFEGLKKARIAANEKTYGQESRRRYGEETMNSSNRKMMELTEEEYQQMEQLEEEIKTSLQEAVKNGNLPAGQEGKRIAQLHRKWLAYSWDSYSPQAHQGLAEMYTTDERFTGYYDEKVQGCAAFLKEAIQAHMK